jgi:hypothetical protein
MSNCTAVSSSIQHHRAVPLKPLVASAPNVLSLAHWPCETEIFCLMSARKMGALGQQPDQYSPYCPTFRTESIEHDLHGWSTCEIDAIDGNRSMQPGHGAFK